MIAFAAISVSAGMSARAATVTITSPTNKAFVRGTATVNVGSTLAGSTSVARLLVDGAATSIVPKVNGTRFIFAWSTTGVADGAHTLSATLTDARSGTAASPLVQITVDNTPPSGRMYQPTLLPGYSYARTNGPTFFQVFASDGYGVRSAQFTVDGKPVGALLTLPDPGQKYLYSINFDTSTLAAGMHSISALVTDRAGNRASAPPLKLKSGRILYVPVIKYHEINPPYGYSIYDQTPAEAGAQLAYLKRKGYQSITLEQYQRWLAGNDIGIAKPVLITVDDGFKSEQAWDPLLQKYGFTAVLFVVTGFADNNTPGSADPNSMTWADIQALAANGRWEIAFHAGRYGHGDYRNSRANIGMQHYTSSCWWFYTCLSHSTTTETLAQFETAVSDEVRAGIAELKHEVPTASLVAWACPRNVCGQWTNQYADPSNAVQAWMPGFFASKFPVVFMQTDPITYGLASGRVGSLTGYNRRYRFEVHTDTTIVQFAAALTDIAFARTP